MSEYTIEKLFDLFIYSLKAEGLTDSTLKKHKNSFKHMHKAFLSQLPDFTKTQIDYFIMKEKERGMSDSSIRNYIKTIRKFGAWLYREGHIEKDPVCDMKYIKSDKSIPDIPSKHKFESIMRTASNLTGDYFRDKRFVFLLKFLSLTGARISTAISIKWGDVDFVQGQIKFLDKKNREYYAFPIHTELDKLLYEYKKFREEYITQYQGQESLEIDPNEHLFFAKDRYIQMSSTLYYKWFKMLKEETDTNIHPHMLRKYFAQQAYEMGMNQYQIQGLLNHASPTMINIYTKHNTANLCMAYNQATERRESHMQGYNSLNF